jgi:DNA-binding response OmpR family regulator
LIDGSGQAVTLKQAAFPGICAWPRRGQVMQGSSLAGRSILIVEDEPLIAINIAAAFEKAGAIVVAARSLREAVRRVEEDGLSAAVLDFGLGDGDADVLCGRLKERAIPFILHSGYAHVGNACHGGIVIPKPANPEALIEALQDVLH